MADVRKMVPENVTGEFFVDLTCIDCDTCRQLAPEVYADAGEYSYVYTQPKSAEAIRHATQALLACPTGSIGTRHANNAKEVMDDFPLLIDEEVYYCGFNSPKSFGGNSYFVRHRGGNWLVDSPKFLPVLVKKFEQMGGLRHIFLTHEDDVADAEKYAKHFGAQRIIHQEELSAQPGAEIIIQGTEPVRIGEEFLVIPTPGHTAGHYVLLYQNRFLFTGDHLWGNTDNQTLGTSRRYSWYSWPQQKKSIVKLLDYPFEWVLPGHGRRLYLPKSEMRQALELLVQKIKASA